MKHEIFVENSGVHFLCDEDESVLDAMRKNIDAPIKCGCHGGGCGICKMKVIQGEYEVTKKMSKRHISDEELQENYILLCCIKPCENLMISKGNSNKQEKC